MCFTVAFFRIIRRVPYIFVASIFWCGIWNLRSNRLERPEGKVALERHGRPELFIGAVEVVQNPEQSKAVGELEVVEIVELRRAESRKVIAAVIT